MSVEGVCVSTCLSTGLIRVRLGAGGVPLCIRSQSSQGKGQN